MNNNNKPKDGYLMRIGEMAEFFNVSQKALRIYEKKGILKPAVVDPATGYRYYTADQVQQLNALIDLKALGFSLKEIKSIMEGDCSAGKLASVMESKKKVWKETIQSAENKIDAIEEITKRIQDSGEAQDIRGMTEEERAWFLVKMVCVEDIRGQHALSEALWL